MQKRDEKAIKSFWQEFLAEESLNPSIRYYDAFYFGGNEALADELLALVLEGKKTATTSAVLSYEAEGLPMPKVGDYSVVTNWAGEPYCVIQTTAVMVLPFNEMTFEICKREGEDECLETWVEGHRRFLSQDARDNGYAFSEDMPVVFEDFDVVYKK